MTMRMLGCAALVVLLAGCNAISVTGKLGERTLNIGGTLAAWLDETEYVADTRGGAPVLKERASDAVLLHLIFTEAIYDPRVDFRALPAAERETIFSDIDRGDILFVDIRRGNVIRVGDPIELVP